jgi:hypothetical protein
MLSAATALGVLAACGSGHTNHANRHPAPDSSPTESATTDTPVDDPPDVVPPFPRGTALQTAKHSGPWDLVLRRVRVGEHEGFDRIVLEFTGRGMPGWAVNYVDRPRLDGSGEHVPLDGEAFLDIFASGTTWSPSDQYDGPLRLRPDHGGGVDEVYVGGTFEGDTQVLVGIGSAPVPFRTFVLAGPPRLVVDVAHDSTG